MLELTYIVVVLLLVVLVALSLCAIGGRAERDAEREADQRQATDLMIDARRRRGEDA